MRSIAGDSDFKKKQSIFKQILLVVLGAALILLVPVLAMQFTDEMDWDLHDFAVAGVLLVGTGLVFVISISKFNKPLHRIVIGIALLLALLLTWVELAVGIVGA